MPKETQCRLEQPIIETLTFQLLDDLICIELTDHVKANLLKLSLVLQQTHIGLAQGQLVIRTQKVYTNLDKHF